MNTPIPPYPTKHNLAADLADRIHGMQADSKFNNAQVIETLLEPVYQALIDAQIKITLLKSQRDHLVAMEERQRMRANSLQAMLKDSLQLNQHGQ